MRRLLSLGSAVLVVAAFGALAPTTAGALVGTKTAAPPVTLVGKVTDKGSQTATGNKIAIVARDYSFAPTFIKAKPGATLTVTITNKGSQDHTFTVPGQNVDVTLTKGKKATVKVLVPSTGALLFYCRFHGANGSSGDLGMQGAIYTQAGQSIANQAAATANVKIATDAKYGKILVNADGQALYQRDSDTATQVTCTGTCAVTWPPAIATGSPVAGTSIDATKLATVNGANGVQITYGGHPLYRYSKDLAVGDTNGEGLAGVWWLVGADGQKVLPAGTTPTSTTPTSPAPASSSQSNSSPPATAATPPPTGPPATTPPTTKSPTPSPVGF
jgi:predicted lipoprotein with Yx(FWY)xxD motif